MRWLKNVIIAKMVLALFFVRLIFSFSVWHPDVNNHIDWGIRFWEYGPFQFYKANVWNFTWPNQPPGSIYIYAFIRKVYEAVFAFFWWVNITIPPFPSGVVTYFESNLYPALLKLPSILADMGIAYLVYKFILKWEGLKNPASLAKLAALLFLVNPAVWYNSTFWGQNDSVINFFALLAFYFLLTKRLIPGIFAFALSIYIKASLLIFAPVFVIVALRQKYRFVSWIKAILLVILVFGLLTLPFSQSEPISWLYGLYKDKVFTQQLHVVTANAFNLWAALGGIHERSDSLFFGPFRYQVWGLVFFCLTYLPALFLVFKKQGVKNIMWSLTLASFSSFMLLTNMHERYLYPAFAPFTVITITSGAMFTYFGVSLISLLNLYNLWWFPKIDFVINFLSWGERVIPRFLGLTNFSFFVGLFLRFLRLLRSRKL